MKDKGRFNQDAKTITDLIFETKFFREDIKRNQMDSIEEFISSMMFTRFESHIKCTKLLESIEKQTNK